MGSLSSSLTPEGINTYRGTPGLNDPTPGIFNIERDGHPHDNLFEDNTISNTVLGVKLKDCDDIIVKGERRAWCGGDDVD